MVLLIAGAMVFSAFILPYLTASLSVQETLSVENEVLDRVKQSIVIMQTPFGVRSGLVLNEDGLVVASDSVLNKKNVLSGRRTGDQVSLKNLHMANNNLALLRISKSGLVNVKFADPVKITAGKKVFLAAAASFEQDD